MTDPTLASSWLRQIARDWNHYNWEYAASRMKPPAFRLDDAEARLGMYNPGQRVLSISTQHIRSDPWSEVRETLLHEMAHQYVAEILRVTDEAPHGPAFQRACEVFRVKPAARASCEERAAGPSGGDERLLGKITRLFALGRSPNENEAQAALRKARTLLARHDLHPRGERAPHRGMSYREVGPLKLRHQGWEYQLSGILSRFFGVETLWKPSFDAATGKTGTVLELNGSPTHLDVAEYVHTCLWRLLPDLWQRYKREQRIQSDRDRRSYYAGVLEGFFDKLKEQEEGLPREEALVLTRRHPDLDAYFRYRHPRVRTLAGGSVRITDAYEKGVADGRTITIDKAIERKEGGPRSLPGG